jgi:RNA polymerase sigma factor (sigma-70 family)
MTRADVCRLIDGLHQSWYAGLVRYAARITGNLDLAQDLVQQSFCDLCSELLRGIRIDSPQAWTLVVVKRAINKALYRDRDRGISFESIDAMDSEAAAALFPVLRVEANGDLDDIARFLACLSPREEEVVLLRLEGCRYEEIARTLGISRETVKTLLARAMKKMQAVCRAPETRPGASPGKTDGRALYTRQ